MTSGESCARVHHAQRCRVSDVTPVIERGMGHRFPVVLGLTAEQPEGGLDINVLSARAEDWCGDGYGHRFGEDNLLGL